MGHIILTLAFFLVAAYVNNEKIVYSFLYFLFSCIILLGDYYYLIFITPTTSRDICFTILSLFTVPYLLYTLGSLTKYLYKFVQHLLSQILSTQATGLKRVIEQITSLILALSAMFTGIYGFISTAKSIIDRISS